MAGEGFDTERTRDPGRAAREAADRIAAQVRDILGSAERRAVEIRHEAERDADDIREHAAGAAARLLQRVDELEQDLESHLTDFFQAVREEVEALAPPEKIEEAAAAAQPPPEELTQDLGQAEERAPGAQQPAPQPEAGEPRRRRGLLRGRRGREEDEPSAAGSDADDAHVMALNMALNGTPREETRDYLVQRFGQMDQLDAILEDVYGRVK